VKFKSHLYYEEKDFVAETEKNLKQLKGSQVCQSIKLLLFDWKLTEILSVFVSHDLDAFINGVKF